MSGRLQYRSNAASMWLPRLSNVYKLPQSHCGSAKQEGVCTCSQVTVNGLLDNPARILSSFQVCSSWVHVVDAILWPSANATLDSIPDPAPGGKFAVGQQQSFPTADNLW